MVGERMIVVLGEFVGEMLRFVASVVKLLPT